MYDRDAFILLGLMFVLSVIVFGAIEYVATYDHEQVHKQIDTYFGCQNSIVHMSFWGTSFTKCLDNNRSVSQEEWALHAFNEVVTYNNTQISYTIIFCTMMIITFLFCLFIYSRKDK